MIDNYNIDYTPYYTIEDGIYKFQDKVAKYKMMYLYGCDCGMERIRHTWPARQRVPFSPQCAGNHSPIDVY